MRKEREGETDLVETASGQIVEIPVAVRARMEKRAKETHEHRLMHERENRILQIASSALNGLLFRDQGLGNSLMMSADYRAEKYAELAKESFDVAEAFHKEGESRGMFERCAFESPFLDVPDDPDAPRRSQRRNDS
jgi:hypothetical protein